MTQGDVVYLSGYGLPRISPLPSAAQVFVDPGPLAAQIPADLLDPVLARCDWLSCNQREAGLLTGSAEPVAAARLLLGGPITPVSSSGPGPRGVSSQSAERR